MNSGESQLTFRTNMSPSSSRSKGKPRRKPADRSCCLLHDRFLIGLLFDPEEGDTHHTSRLFLISVSLSSFNMEMLLYVHTLQCETLKTIIKGHSETKVLAVSIR
jgi:hypothetical protein